MSPKRLQAHPKYGPRAIYGPCSDFVWSSMQLKKGIILTYRLKSDADVDLFLDLMLIIFTIFSSI